MSLGQTPEKTPSPGIQTLGLGKKSRSKVSFVDEDRGRKRRGGGSLSRLDAMKAELEKMKQRDEEAERKKKELRERELAKVKAEFAKARLEKGIQMYPDVRERKQEMGAQFQHELDHAMQGERTTLAAESARIKHDLSLKYGLHIKTKRPDLVKLADDFINPAKAANEFGLPERIVKELTEEEIQDLKQIFDLFDVTGAGHIKAKDVQKMATLLGFRAKKEVFQGMIEELSQDHDGMVTFIDFLDFIIKNQEGADPFDEIQQAFKLLDQEKRGFITYEDLRLMADDLDCNLSNRMLQEMVDEADTSGDGRISIDEFTLIMLRTSAFRSL